MNLREVEPTAAPGTVLLPVPLAQYCSQWCSVRCPSGEEGVLGTWPMSFASQSTPFPVDFFTLRPNPAVRVAASPHAASIMHVTL